MACCRVCGSAVATCAGTGADFFGALLRDAGTFPAAAFFAGVLLPAVAVFARVLFAAVAVFAGVFFAAAFFAGVLLPAVAVFAGVLFAAAAFLGSGAATGAGSSSRPMGAGGGSGSAGPVCAGAVCAGADFPAGVRFVPETAFRAFGALVGAGSCRSPAG